MRRPVLFTTLAAAAVAASLAIAAEPPQVHALTGVRIVVAPGEVIEQGTVVLRDGIIEAVGGGLEPPPDARIWEREELTVYAGLIEPYAVLAAPDAAGEDGGAERQGGHANVMVRPERDVTTYAVKEELARKLREAGFTTAVMAPKEGLFRGSGVLLNLGDGGANANLLRRDVAQFASLQTNEFGGGYPGSLMGAVALFRQTLADAAWYSDAHAAYARRPAQARPPLDTALAALGAAAAGEQRVVLETRDVVDSLRVAGLAAELGLDAWLVGNGYEYQWLDEIAASGLPHLLPLDLPKAPAVGKQDDLSVGLDDLRHWDEAASNPRRLLEAGLTVALTSHGLAEPKQLHANLARAIDDGLTAEQALAALTTTPAALLGVADRAGTLSAGKMANLVVVDGDLFAKETRVREVWIDGRRYEVKESKPPEVEPAGTWEVTVLTGDGQQIGAVLELRGEAPSLEGSISAQGQSIDLSSAEVSASSVEIAFDGTRFGIPGTITFTMEISGDEASGPGMSPGGPFTITATRTAKPEVSR